MSSSSSSASSIAEGMDSSSKFQYFDDLYSALQSVERLGSFSFGGVLKSFCLPGLEVPGIGPIGLPLSSQQAEALAKVCSQAPFGRKNATIYDESVRKCLQLPPHQFSLANLDWNRFVRQLANQKVKAGLGLPDGYEVVPHLYKLLLYQPGGYFTSHRDSEKEEGMFGTLVFVLPFVHEGGELVIRHSGQENRFDFSKENLYRVHYAAFFADCEHEILPVRAGYRLALVYNLIAKGSSRVLLPADNTRAVQQMVAALNAWNRDEEGPQKLILPLKHKYSSESLSFDRLRGSDIATLDVLLQTAKICDAVGPAFHFALGMLEMNDHIHTSSYSRTPGETRTYLTMRNMLSSDEATYCFFKAMKADKEDLVPRNALESHEWDDTHEWDTGNEGTEEDRWYHHAAVVIWPHTKTWEIASINSFDEAVKDASSLSHTLDILPALLEAACLAAGHLSLGEAATVASLVVARAHGNEMPRALSALCAQCKRLIEEYNQPSDPLAKAFVQLIVKHGDMELAKGFLSEGYRGPNIGQYKEGQFEPPEWHVPLDVMAPLGARFGWKNREPEMLKAVRRSVNTSIEICFRVLLDMASPRVEEGLAPKLSKGAASERQFEREKEREAVCCEAVRIVIQKWPELTSYNTLDALIEHLAGGEYYLVLDRFGWEPFVPLIDSSIENTIVQWLA